MGALGERLKKAREEKGRTLKELADRTRISQTYLKALEDEDFGVIPAEVYVTGFLRSYARELGLDEVEVFALYRKTAPAPAEPSVQEVQHIKPAVTAHIPADVPVPGPSIRTLTLVSAAVLVVLVIAGAVVYHFLSKTPEPKPVVPPPAPVKRVAPPIANTTSHTPVNTNITTAKKNVVTVKQVNPPAKGKLIIKLAADDTSWYSYRLDKGDWTSGLLMKGKDIEVGAEYKITLSLGNAGGVRVMYGGKQLKPFGPRGASVKGIVFTKDQAGVVFTSKKNEASKVASEAKKVTKGARGE